MTSLPDRRPLPASEDDREAAVQRLRDAYAGGHISHEELDERLHQVLTATTGGELGSALSSLPAEDAATTSTIAAGWGRLQRRGVWRVPRNLNVESAFGKVRLDLSRAIIEHPVVDIRLQLGTGGARITVPGNAIVDIEGLRTMGKAPRYQAPRRSSPGGPTIRISGTMGIGRLRIRYARH